MYRLVAMISVILAYTAVRGLDELSSSENTRLEFPEVIASQIVTAFFAPGVSFVMTGEPASEKIAGKLSVDSLVVSHRQIRAELFLSRRFSGFYGFTASFARRNDQNSHFPVARWGIVDTHSYVSSFNRVGIAPRFRE